MWRFLFAFLLFASTSLAQIEIEPYISGGGGGLTVGTANTIPKWNAVPDDLVDSLISDDGSDLFVGDDVGFVFGVTNDADLFWDNGNTRFTVDIDNGGSLFVTLDGTANTSLVDISAAIPITAAAETTNVFDLSVTNTNHTGGNVNGINVGAITGDADASEYAIHFSTGWDKNLYADTVLSLQSVQQTEIRVGSNNYLSVSNDSGYIFVIDDRTAQSQVEIWSQLRNNTAMLELKPATQVLMDGSDVERGIFIDLPNGDHTGASNFLYGLDIDGITGDADATEVAINIGAGWDYEIVGTDDIDINPLGGDYKVWISQTYGVGDGSGNAIAWSNPSDAISLTPDTVAGSGRVTFLDTPAAGSGEDLWKHAATMPIMNGSDTIRMHFIDITNANHTGADNFLYGLDIDGITGDADATESAINIGSGWDTLIDLTNAGANHVSAIALADGGYITSTGHLNFMTTHASANMYFRDNLQNIVLSVETNDNAANSIDVVSITRTLPIADGSETMRGLFVDLTNANHTGASNFLYGLDIDGITGDADASEFAIHIGSGWGTAATDGDIWFDTDTARIQMGATGGYDGYLAISSPDAGANVYFSDILNSTYAMLEVGGALRRDGNVIGLEVNSAMTVVMDGSDTYRGAFIDLVNVDHTGASNFLYGLDIDGITGDANATENAINIGDGWDSEINFVGSSPIIQSPTGSYTYLKAGGENTLYYTNIPGVGAGHLTVSTAGIEVGAHMLEIFGTLLAANGSDVTAGINIELTQGNPTGVSNFLYGINIAGITGDADASEYAINIGAGWDKEIYFQDAGYIGSAGAMTIHSSSGNYVQLGDPTYGASFLTSPNLNLTRIKPAANDAISYIDFEQPVAGAGGLLTDLYLAVPIMNGSDTTTLLSLRPTNSDHTGASNFLYGIDIGGITADADATEAAINIGAGWDSSIQVANRIQSAGGVNLDFLPQTSRLRMLDASGNQVIDYQLSGAIGTQYIEITDTVAAMDGSDTIQGIFIDLANADHTGASNFLYGLDIDGITGDADASEYAIHIGDGWDKEIFMEGSAGRIDTLAAAITLNGADNAYYVSVSSDNGNFVTTTADSVLQVAGTLGAMNGSDDFSGIFIDLVNNNHSGESNFLYGIEIDDIVEDPDAFESAVIFGSGFDAHFTLVERGGAYADNPPSGAVAFFLDDNADWSGGGGNDCALVAQDSTGTTTVIATLVLNGVCP